MSKTEIIAPLMIACNNPENGQFDGFLRGVQVGVPEILELECCVVDEENKHELGGLDIELAPDSSYLRITSKQTYTLPLLGRKPWVGNWCWDCVLVALPELTDFLNWLMQTNTFWCTSGLDTLHDAWHDMESFTEGLLREALSDQGGDIDA